MPGKIGRSPRHCDLRLRDGATQYEGAFSRLADGMFLAHVREVVSGAGRASGARSLVASPGEFQNRFLGRRFRADLPDCPEAAFEAEIFSVQKSSESVFEFCVSGRLRPLEAEGMLPAAAERSGGTPVRPTRIWM